jgi:hypothetical protein
MMDNAIERLNGMATKPLICSDCKWYVPKLTRSMDECVSPQSLAPLDLVRGEPMRQWTYCRDARDSIISGCGKDGKWFRQIIPSTTNTSELVEGLSAEQSA